MMNASCKFVVKEETAIHKGDSKQENPFRVIQNREHSSEFWEAVNQRTALIAQAYAREFAKLESEKAALKKENAALKEKSYRDARTGLYSNTFFEDIKNDNNSFRYLMFLDIDDLKSWNNLLTHEGADQVIKALADKFQSLVRDESDYCIRYGGDEFALVFHVEGEHDRYEKIKEIKNRLTKELTNEGVNVTVKSIHGITEVTAYMSIGEAFCMYANNKNSEEAVQESIELASNSCLNQKRKNKKMRNQIISVPHLV